MSDAILTAGSGQRWENELVALLGTPDAPDAAPLVLLRRCVDVAELVSVAETGQVAAAVVDADLRRLSSDVVGRLTGAGVAVIGIFPAAEPRSQQVLSNMGVTASADDATEPGQLIDVIRTAILTARLDRPASGGWTSPRPSASRTLDRAITPDSLLDKDSEPTGEPDLQGTVIAVWGPAGGPGRTTVALNLAAELAESTPTLLIDADPYGGVIATALGLLDESPGLAGACRFAAHGRLVADRLAGLCWQVGDLRVLSGIARADRWPELRPSAIPTVLELARQQAEVVIVDVGFNLEADEELSFDTSAPRRNGATLAVLEQADLVLAVGSADPPGMERLIRGLGELDGLIDGTPRVILNRQRRSASSAAEAAEALARFTGLGVLATLPEDRAGTDAAWQQAAPLRDAAPRSALRTAVRKLAGELVPTPARR